MDGNGSLNYWGFTPPLDLCNYVNSNSDNLRMLIVGAGDPRHILKTLSWRKRHPYQTITIYVLEVHMEVYARLLLLLSASLRRGLRLPRRVLLTLDLWGNLLISKDSSQFLQEEGRRLARIVTEPSEYGRILGVATLEALKYKERDALDAILRSWSAPRPESYDPLHCRDLRLRSLLGTRYDYRQGWIDWAWQMRLLTRLEKLEGLRTKEGFITRGWGKGFIKWRMTGQAFQLKEGTLEEELQPNYSLSSVAMLPHQGARTPRLGYWGDLLTGPLPGLCMISESRLFCKTRNGLYAKGASAAAYWNLASYLKELWSGTALKDLEEDDDQDSLGIGELEELEDAKEDAERDLELEGVKICLLQPSKGYRLGTMREIEGKLDLIYISAAMVHVATPEFFADGPLDGATVLLVEGVDLFPELTDSQSKEYAGRMERTFGEMAWKSDEGSNPPFHQLFFREEEALSKEILDEGLSGDVHGHESSF